MRYMMAKFELEKYYLISSFFSPRLFLLQSSNLQLSFLSVVRVLALASFPSFQSAIAIHWIPYPIVYTCPLNSAQTLKSTAQEKLLHATYLPINNDLNKENEKESKNNTCYVSFIILSFPYYTVRPSSLYVQLYRTELD